MHKKNIIVMLIVSLSCISMQAEDPLADFLGNRSYDREGIVRQLSESQPEVPESPYSGGHPLLRDLVIIERLALVLPVESRGLAGQVARDFEAGCRHGILGDGRDIQIGLYGHDGNSSLEYYRAAVEQGADIVIGPMLKRGVEALLEEFPEMPVPTLLLQPGEGYFVMSLDGAQEASDLAEMLRESPEEPLIVVQDTLRGEQLASSFASEWRSGGGGILEHFRIEEEYEEDPTETWSRLFDKLKPPEREEEEEEEPEPLPAAVPVFAAGDGKFAELVRNFSPQRNRVYGLSTANTGGDPNTALLLENLGFMEMPWFTGLGELERYDSLEARRISTLRQRFFVLGADACRSVLDMRSWSEGWELLGLGGRWRLKGETFRRRGVLASYRGGILEEIEK